MSQKPNILIAEDEQSVRELLNDLLITEYNITEVKNGGEAVQAIQLQSFDLLLLDIMMPIKSGYQVAKEMKSLNIEVPFIFLSAKSDSHDRIIGMELGADDFIIKPFTNKELQLRIKNKLSVRNKIDLRDKQLDLVHHNVMTPTGAIHGALQFQTDIIEEMDILLSARVEDDQNPVLSAGDISRLRDQLKESTSWINQSCDQLIRMCHNSSITKEIVEISLNASIYSAKDLISDSLNLFKPKTLLCQLPVQIPNVELYLDMVKIRSVIFELMDNSVLHNNSKPPKLTVEVEIDSDNLIISFTDNGRGIPAEDFNNIFTEYWIGHRNINHTRGQGMGLWICKKYLQAHHGDIWVSHSKPGEYTCISFSLPIHKEDK